LNNVVEQRSSPSETTDWAMLGFKRFDTATITISASSWRKDQEPQFKKGKLAGRSATASAIWAAVLAA